MNKPMQVRRPVKGYTPGAEPPTTEPVATPAPVPVAGQAEKLLPLDTLAEEAMADPLFAQGRTDTTLATAHPQLALKYGINRSGERRVWDAATRAWVQPQEVKPPEPVQADEPDDELAEDLAERGFTPFEQAQIREHLYRDLLNNPEQRQRVEKRLKPWGVDDLRRMVIGELLEQRIPIYPGVYEPVFRQNPYGLERELQELIVINLGGSDVNKLHLMELYSFYGMVCALRELGTPYPEVTESGKLNTAKLQRKVDMVSKLPGPVIASLMANYAWFDLRARAILQVTELKNG